MRMRFPDFSKRSKELPKLWGRHVIPTTSQHKQQQRLLSTTSLLVPHLSLEGARTYHSKPTYRVYHTSYLLHNGCFRESLIFVPPLRIAPDNMG